MDTRRLLGLLVFMLQIGFVGCMDNATSNSYGSNPSPPPQTNTFAMSNASFSPTSMTVRVGTSVTWRNNDGVVHTSTSDSSGVWDTGDIAPGSSKAVTFATAGTFKFHCKYHRAMGMTGTIIVN